MIINNYKNRNSISFQKIPLIKINKMNFFDEIHCKVKADEFSDKYREYRVMCDFYSPMPEREFNINVNDNNYIEIGKSNLIKYKDILRNTDIRVLSERKKHSGAGSAMRLGQIITMLENDINKLELNSLGQAVYFHTMFKFKPIIQDPDNIAGFITYNILCRKGDNRFEKIVNKAENWLNRHEKNSKESINEGNEIIYEYCTNVIKHKLHKNNDYQISTGGFDMVLKKDDVLKNKDFFNGLFKKFHIDYEIE